MLKVSSYFEEFDENGEITDVVGSEFSSGTLLQAIKAWEKGENYTPGSVSP